MDWNKKGVAVGLVLLVSPGLARAEGALNIYNWGNYTSPDMIKKFEQKYSVKVTVTDYDSNDTALAKIRQGGHGYDVVVPSQSVLPFWIEAGLLLETRPDMMENFNNVAERWKNPSFDPGRHYTVPWTWGTNGVVVNTAVYKGDINTWSIIFNTPDELKGKVNVVPEPIDVIYAAIKYVGGEQCTEDKQVLRKVRDVLVAAKANWIAMEYNVVDKMTSGDFSASLDWSGSALRQRLQMPSIHFGYPKEGFFYWSDNLAVLKDAKNVENAKLFQNFMMDPENAAMNTAFHRYANAISGSEQYLPENIRDAPELKVPQEFLGDAEDSRMCPADVRNIYLKIWTELQK